MGKINNLTEQCRRLTGTDLDFKSNPKWSSFDLTTVMYEKSGAGGVTVTLSVIFQGVEYTIDTVAGVTTYVFPNARVPQPIALTPEAIVRFTTSGVAAGDSHSVVFTMSEIGV